MTKSNPLTRESNIELLRSVLMFMIIIHHLITRGVGLSLLLDNEYIYNNRTIIVFLLNSFVIIGVNAFVFISSYYQMRFKMKRFISLIVQILFFSILCYLIAVLLGFVTFSIKGFILSFTYIIRSWWFVPAYLILYLISPILNKGLEALNQIQLSTIIVIFFVLCNIKFINSNVVSGTGYSLINFIFIYFLGFYMKRFNVNIKFPLYAYFFLSLLLYFSSYFVYSHGNQGVSWSIYNYNNPLIIASAILFFFSFKRIKIKSSFVNKIAGFVFGIYLFHEHADINPIIEKIVKYFDSNTASNFLFFLFIFLFAMVIFTIGVFLDYIREKICSPIVNKITTNSKIRYISKAFEKG